MSKLIRNEKNFFIKRDCVDDVMEVLIKLKIIDWFWLASTDGFTRRNL